MQRLYGTVSVVLVAALVGCGGGGNTSQTASSQPPKHARGAKRATVSGSRAEGRQACRGLTPIDAARRFRTDAVKAGVRRSFAQRVADPTAAVESSPGYPRLVAALYATTVEPKARAQAAAGCAEMLAAQAGGKASSERAG